LIGDNGNVRVGSAAIVDDGASVPVVGMRLKSKDTEKYH
jgi:hypothetical protein